MSKECCGVVTIRGDGQEVTPACSNCGGKKRRGNREQVTLDVICALGEMNRGIDAYVNAIREEERARIIALLEPFTHACQDGCNCDDPFAYAIALIKGEQK